jgi:hypothetical protein
MKVSVCISNFSVHAEEDSEKNILTLFTPLLLSLLLKPFKVLADQIISSDSLYSATPCQPHTLHCAARYDYLNYNHETCERKRSWHISRHYPSTCVAGSLRTRQPNHFAIAFGMGKEEEKAKRGEIKKNTSKN